MKSSFIRILLLCTFVYWGTGTAKFLHELVEHHGGRDDVVAAAGDDDDGDVATVLATVNANHAEPATASHDKQPKPLRHDQACFICQQLSVMAAERSAPPALPAPSREVIHILTPPHWEAPVIRVAHLFPLPGPPPSCVVA